jgi:hypothetical protein
VFVFRHGLFTRGKRQTNYVSGNRGAIAARTDFKEDMN